MKCNGYYKKLVSLLCVLTLNDVRHHESGAGVVADEATAGQVVFYLQRKQIPGKERQMRPEDRKPIKVPRQCQCFLLLTTVNPAAWENHSIMGKWWKVMSCL